jgi:hypothetical protein
MPSVLKWRIGSSSKQPSQKTTEAVVSLRDFWVDIRNGAGFVSPTVVVDRTTLDASWLERILRAADLWLTPSLVSDFRDEDFDFLDPEERSRLAQHVSNFRAVASGVPSDAPATREQVKRALLEFQGILEIVRPDKYGDPEAFRIGKMIEQITRGRLPGWVRGLRFETGDDASGDPALWVWAEVDDDAADSKVLGGNFEQLRELVGRAVADVNEKLKVERWPYIRLRTASEQRAASKKGLR